MPNSEDLQQHRSKSVYCKTLSQLVTLSLQMKNQRVKLIQIVRIKNLREEIKAPSVPLHSEMVILQLEVSMVQAMEEDFEQGDLRTPNSKISK